MMGSLTEISYGLATIGYLFFTLLLLTSRGKNLLSYLLLVVVAASGLWAAQIPISLYSGRLNFQDAIYFDGFRTLMWILFLLAITTNRSFLALLIKESRLLLGAIGVYLLMLLMRIVDPIHVWVESMLGWEPEILSQVLLICFVLVTLERLYRSTDSQMRWAIRPLVIALSILFIYDFYMYAQAALFAEFEPVLLLSRGFLHLVALPALLLSTKRTSQWSSRIFISRGVVYHGSLLIVAGAYLTIMSIVGYYIKYLGGEWGGEMRSLFFVLALLMLSFIFMSEPFRLKVKVFISKHFFANRYEYRDEWLAVTRALSRPAKQCSIYEHTLSVMMERLGCKQGMFFRIQGQNLELQSNIDFEQLSGQRLPTSLARTLGFIRSSRWIIDTEEFRSRPQHYPNLVMDTYLLQLEGIWLLVPIFDGDDLIALLVLGRSNQLKKLNWEDRDYINTIGNQLANFVVLHEASAQLAEAKQFDTFNQMSAFLVHDLKNTLAQLSMIVVNAEKHKTNPEFIDDSLDTLANAVKRMQRMLDQLKRNKPQPKELRRVELAPLLRKICQNLSYNNPIPSMQCGDELYIVADKERIENVITHLVQNAQEATDDSGSVSLAAVADQQWISIMVEDTGSGMDSTFIRDRLFIPFDTTKGNAGMGIGVYEVRQFALEAGGKLDVTSEIGIGTRFTLKLPAPQKSADGQNCEKESFCG